MVRVRGVVGVDGVDGVEEWRGRRYDESHRDVVRAIEKWREEVSRVT